MAPRNVIVRRAALAAFIVSTLGAMTAGGQAAGSATVSGTIISLRTEAPLIDVQVEVAGTNLTTRTNEQGKFAIHDVPRGIVVIRAMRVGYAEQKRYVDLRRSVTGTQDFVLEPVTTELAPVVTTVTGEQRRLEVGNAIAVVPVASVVETSPIRSMTDVLTARTPGLDVLPVGATGGGARIRIRGATSISLGNDPIYVIDGIRLEAASANMSISTGGTAPSRLNDINPDEIESLEVVKGPSASTLYGTDAANGVIVITTKRGRAGRARWSSYAENGSIVDLHDFPANYTRWGKVGTAASSPDCWLTSVAARACSPDSLTSFNPMETKDVTILGTGHRQQLGLQVRGGSDVARYFISGDWEDELGALKLPDFERLRLEAKGAAIPNYQARPNTLGHSSVRANLSVLPSQQIDFQTSSFFTTSRLRLPNLDNNVTGPIGQVYQAIGRRNEQLSSTGVPLIGYRSYTPGDIFEESFGQRINRFVGSGTANWRPLSWLTGRAVAGVDFSSRVDTDLCRLATCADFSTYRLGFARDNRGEIQDCTVDVSGGAHFRPTSSMTARTSVGVQYFRRITTETTLSAFQLAPGSQSASGGGGTENTDETRTLGAFVEQSLGWRDRLFVTVATRFDDNSAFGAAFDGKLYPKASVSWVAMEEGDARRPSWLTLARLRAAIGQSGLRPGSTAAVPYYQTASLVQDNRALAGVALSSPGNVNLRPETTQEIEAGADATLFGSRLSVQLTYYDKSSRDAMIARIVPPSAGTQLATRLENLGRVSNRGWEASVDAQLLDAKHIAWDASLTAYTNTNRVVDMGGVPPQVGTTSRVIPGYPLTGYWQRRYAYADRDANGIITVDEITADDSASYVGTAMPTRTLTLVSGVDLFRRRLRISAQLEHKGGHVLFNNSERFRCTDARNCRGRNDPSASLFEQARSVAATEHDSRTLAGYFEPADFTRLREVSMSVLASERWAKRIGASRAMLTFAARNVAWWTRYTGVDVESNYSQTEFPSDFLTLPPSSYFTLRLSLDF